MTNGKKNQMKSSVHEWQEQSGEKVLRKIGIEKGQKVLDFGCGQGNYTIPAARLVGEQALVYALDEDEAALDQLMSNVESMGLKNVKRLDLSGKSRIGLDNESVDVVLLYDVLHYYYFPKEEDRRQLLREVYRVLKPHGLLSVYPTHLESHMEPKLDDVKREIEESNFRKQDEFNGMIMIHDDNVEEGTIINFKKGEVTAW